MATGRNRTLYIEHEVSQGTAPKAIDSLLGNRLLLRRQAKGTYVASHNSDLILFHFLNILPNVGKRHLSVMFRAPKRLCSSAGYTHPTSRCRFQQGQKQSYLRHVILELVILAQNCLTKKRVVYSLALRVLS